MHLALDSIAITYGNNPTATLTLDGLILLRPHLGKLITRTSSEVALHFAVDIHRGTVFIDFVMCKIFPLECKAVPWHLRDVPILAHGKSSRYTCKASIILKNTEKL